MKTKPKWRTREIWWCTAHDHRVEHVGPQGYWSYRDSEDGLVISGRVTPCDIFAALLVLDRETSTQTHGSSSTAPTAEP